MSYYAQYYTIAEGSSLVLAGSGSDLGLSDAAALTYSWDLNDDESFGDATGATPTVSWAALNALGLNDNGSYTITLRVSDDDTSTDAMTTLTINNVGPTVSVGADETINEGAPFTRMGSFTDPGTADTWTATVDYDDGTGPQLLAVNPDKTFSLNYLYTNDGTYSVTVNVQDDDAGVGNGQA